MEERDFLAAFIQSSANFNVYPQFSWVEDPAALLKDFCTASTKRDYWCNTYYTNIKVRRKTHKIYTQNLPPYS